MEGQLKTLFYTLLFQPLVKILQSQTAQVTGPGTILKNAAGNLGALTQALRTGRIQWNAGIFSGEFSTAITKDLKALGAVYDARSRLYRLSVAETPAFVKAESAAYNDRARQTHEALQRELNRIDEHLDRLVTELNVDAEPTMNRIEQGWRKAAKVLEVQPKLGPEAKARLAKDYNQNLKLYINNFSRQQIVTLRKDVNANALEGYRFDKMIETIRHRYGVTASKAKFLARQETGLFMAKYRKERFAQSGVRRYIWSTAHDEKVREIHRELGGRTFAYSEPPVTNHEGDHNNPGEDYNCRCVDKPILEEAPPYL